MTLKTYELFDWLEGIDFIVRGSCAVHEYVGLPVDSESSAVLYASDVDIIIKPGQENLGKLNQSLLGRYSGQEIHAGQTLHFAPGEPEQCNFFAEIYVAQDSEMDLFEELYEFEYSDLRSPHTYQLRLMNPKHLLRQYERSSADPERQQDKVAKDKLIVEALRRDQNSWFAPGFNIGEQFSLLKMLSPSWREQG